jgi:signal transduction histidine kinase
MQLDEAAQGVFIEVRQAILDLRLAGQIGTDLKKTLPDFIVQFSRLSDLPIHLELDPKFEKKMISAQTELQLFRILQEALHNIRKHARATQVWVSMAILPGSIALVVRDDGVGFDMEAATVAQDPRHFGLVGMQDRVRAMGGVLEITTAHAQGTCLTVRIPL